MNITSATFVKGVVDPNELLKERLPQVACIGRSNVGKSSIINLLTKQKGLAKTGSFPGRTQQLNVFLINNKFHLIDLPGYGFACVSAGGKAKIFDMINGYLFGEGQEQAKVVLIVDGYVGPTKDDMEMLSALEEHGKDILVVINKIDKMKKSDLKVALQTIQSTMGPHTYIPFSVEKKIGVGELTNAIFGN